uniref:Fucosyltransferase n=2 Tax=Meloidogyne TaxID=189290 RepID=A0A6V7W3N8_MELEN|nr:unnamed protein product [Meloidogyne enterolobii]
MLILNSKIVELMLFRTITTVLMREGYKKLYQVKNHRKISKLKCNIVLVFAIQMIFMLVVIYFVIIKMPSYTRMTQMPITISDSFISNKSKPIILGWNNHFVDENVMVILTGLYNTDECPYECEYSANKNLYLNASAIIYHIRDEHKNLPEFRFSNQLYVFFLEEPPILTFKHFKDVANDFFNITMTYRADSNIYYPYDALVPCNGECQVDEYWKENEVLENVRKKTKLAMQAVTNCNTESKREDIVAELNKFIKIDLYGKCVGNKCDFEQCLKQELANHMFYLAFENSVCKEYITEKFWNLKHLIVPIVLSRRVFNHTKIPDNVYIAVDDFNNVEELAKYLLYLQKNETAYLKYFDWTKTYRKTTYRSNFDKYVIYVRQAYVSAKNITYAPSYNPLCNLCELVHKQQENNHPKHIISDIWKYWYDPNFCIKNWADKWLRSKDKGAFRKSMWQ